MGSERRVLAALRKHGLLLKQDKTLASVVGLVAGEALAGSWWSHLRAKEIYDVLDVLTEREDVLESKLIGGKVTFVFATLWPALLGVGMSRDPWQLEGLTPAAKKLLVQVEERSELEASGAAVKELETRLLVRSEQRHTRSGKHVLVLEAWSPWAERHAIFALSASDGKDVLEHAARSLGAPMSALPWQRQNRRSVRAR